MCFFLLILRNRTDHRRRFMQHQVEDLLLVTCLDLDLANDLILQHFEPFEESVKKNVTLFLIMFLRIVFGFGCPLCVLEYGFVNLRFKARNFSQFRHLENAFLKLLAKKTFIG